MRIAAVLTFLLSLLPFTGTASAIDKSILGVKFSSIDWSDDEHADSSYRAIKKIQKQLARGDFYYRLVVYPKYLVTFSNCDEAPTIEAFLSQFVGVTDKAFLTVSALIRHQNKAGETELAAKYPVIIVGRGVVDNNGTSGNGCFFDQALKTKSPLMRYAGGDVEKFLVRYTVSKSKETTVNAVARMKSLFTALNSTFNWTDITGERVKEYNDAATELQTAFNNASKVSNSAPVDVELVATGGYDKSRLKLTVPTMIDRSTRGYLSMFVELSGSQILNAKSRVELADVFENQDIGRKTCVATGGEKLSGCKGEAKNVREFLASKIEKMPVRFFDLLTQAERAKVAKTCDQIRIAASGDLLLSTTDALLVRWATVKEGGLLSLFERVDKKETEAIDTLNKLASENNMSAADLRAYCWTKDDHTKLEKIVREVTSFGL